MARNEEIDPSLIRDEAEVVGWTSRVEHITYTESILLGDPFYFLSNWPPIKLIQRIPSCAVCRYGWEFAQLESDFMIRITKFESNFTISLGKMLCH